MKPLPELAAEVERKRTRQAVSLETRKKVLNTLEPVSRKWERLYQPYGERQFLTRYIRNERDAFRESDGDRDEPLCECANPMCPLKRGELPPTIRDADDLTAAMYRYQDRHPDAVILLEARDALADQKREIRSAFREAIDLLETELNGTRSVADLSDDGTTADMPATAANTEPTPDDE